MCCDSPPAPDLTPIAQQNAESARYAKESADADLAFRKQVYTDQAPRQQELMDLAKQVAQQQLGITDESAGRARQQWDDYQKSYRPNELMTLADAYGQQYLGDEDRAGLNSLLTGGGGTMTDDARLSALQMFSRKAEGAAGDAAAQRAGGEVNRAFGMQSRQLGRFGAGDPQRMAVMAAKLGQQQTLAQVGASNSAREGVRSQQLGLRTGVANFGRNMPNTAGQAFGLATQAGNSAVANQNAAFMSGLPYAQFATGGVGNQLGAAGLGIQGQLGLGSLQNQQYQAQVGMAGAGQQGLGQLVGLGLSSGGQKPWWLGS